MPWSPAHIRTVVADELRRWQQLVGGLGDSELVLGTRCRGWRVADLLVHVRLDAAALLEGLHCPTDQPADRDAVTYWHEWPAGPPPTFDRLRFLWATSASYATGAGLREHFLDTVTAAVHAVETAPAGRLGFQTHVIGTDDFLVTWAVELAVHHLDLLAELPALEGPEPAALAMAAATIDGLLGRRRPEGWDDTTYVLKGTGRLPLDAAEKDRLGDTARRYPAFG